MSHWTKDVAREAEASPGEWLDGVPYCADSCPKYDGKRCLLTGSRPRGICEPCVQQMATRLNGGVPIDFPAKMASALREEVAATAWDEPPTAVWMSEDGLCFSIVGDRWLPKSSVSGANIASRLQQRFFPGGKPFIDGGFEGWPGAQHITEWAGRVKVWP